MGRKAGGGLRASLRNQVKVTQIQQLKKDKIDRHLQQQGAQKHKRLKINHAYVKPSSKWVPFSDSDLVILLGEGDFGYSSACLKGNMVGDLISTGYDTEKEITSKYSTAQDNIKVAEEDERATVLHEVDARALEKSKALVKAIAAWKDRVEAEKYGGDDEEQRKIVFVFNFPHIGNSMKDQDRNILQHQKLMTATLKSVKRIDPGAELAITMWEGEPYRSWEVKRLAKEQGFTLVRSNRFNWELYDGYTHRLTAKEGSTHKSQREREARVYLFSQTGIKNINK